MVVWFRTITHTVLKGVHFMKKKTRLAVKCLVPVFLMLWFPARFYCDIMHYYTHFEDIPALLFELIGIILCTAGIIRAVKRCDRAYAAWIGCAPASCIFFGYWTNRIPFCVEYNHISRDELGFMLEPFADQFGWIP